MGKRGPAPMPTKLRLLTGDPNKDRYNEHEPQAAEGDLPVPADVSAAVARVWRERLVDLKQMGLAYPCDVDSWRAYCEAVVIHESASAVLANSPVLIKGLHGGLVRNPALQVQRDAALTLLRFATHFGLTPSARSSIDARPLGARGGESSDNPFAGAG